MSISNHITDTFDLRDCYKQICEDAAMYQAVAMPSLGFGQKDFGRNFKKSITGGTFDVTSIGTSYTAECEEGIKNEHKRRRVSKTKNKRNNKSSLQRLREICSKR